MKNKTFILSILVIIFLLSTPLYADALLVPGPGIAQRVQKQYSSLLLKLRNVKYITTASCEEISGALVTDYKYAGPTIDCIAVRMNSTLDVAAVESIFENPLRQDGVLIHFTDLDPIPNNKGGITVHN